MEPTKPRWIAGLGLFTLAITVFSSLALSRLAVLESFQGISDAAVAQVPNGSVGMVVRTLIHVLLIGYAVAAAIGAVVRRPWGHRLGQWFIPVRWGLLLLLIVAGWILELRLYLRLESGLLETSFVFAALQLPWYFFSRQLRAFYRVGVPLDGSSPDPVTFDTANPYRRS